MELPRRGHSESRPAHGIIGETVLGIPRFRPMLAERAPGPFDNEDWVFEVKWDGYRALAYIGDEVYLDSRNGKPLLPAFPGLAAVRTCLRCNSALLDGEIVAFRAGRVDFSYLRSSPEQVVFVAFDILFLDGEVTVDMPLFRRLELLRSVVVSGGDALVVSSVVVGEGKSLFAWVVEQGMEGMMAKERHGRYAPGRRSGSWLKIRNYREGRFWVVGFLPSPGRSLGSLVLADKVGGTYSIVGRVSSGLNREYEEALLDVLEPVHLDASSQEAAGGKLWSMEKASFMNALLPRDRSRITWVVPYFGVEVSYTEMTPDKRLRHPVFKDIV